MFGSRQSSRAGVVETVKRASLILFIVLSFGVGIYTLVRPTPPHASWSEVQAEFDKAQAAMPPEQRAEGRGTTFVAFVSVLCLPMLMGFRGPQGRSSEFKGKWTDPQSRRSTMRWLVVDTVEQLVFAGPLVVLAVLPGVPPVAVVFGCGLSFFGYVIAGPALRRRLMSRDV